MPQPDIRSLFSRKGIWRNRELVAEGVSFRAMAEAIADGVIHRPVFSRLQGPAPGILVSPELNRDPDRAIIVASVLTGGVIGRHSAAARQNLSTNIPRRVEVHVGANYSHPTAKVPMLAMRADAGERRLSVGVDWEDTEFGVQIRVTTPARTVVDILHSGRRDTRDYEHGLEAIEAFLENGGEPGEIVRVADDLGADWDGRIKLSVNAIEMGRGGRMRP